MKSALLVTILHIPVLASSAFKLKKSNLTQPRETYADYARKNGIALDRSRAASYQYVDCYDRFGGQGNTIRIDKYIDNLQNFGWNDRFSSCCYNGVWNLYEDRDYNSGRPTVRQPFHWIMQINQILGTFSHSSFRLEAGRVGVRPFARICKAVHPLTTKLAPSGT